MEIGMVSSPAHVLTNKEVKDKKGCLKEIYKQALKDQLVLTGTVAGAGVAAGLATKFSTKAADLAKKAISKTGKMLSKVSIDGNNLKETVKSSGLYKNFSALPAPVKAGIMAATAVLAAVLPVWAANSAAKTGKVEGNFEVKNA